MLFRKLKSDADPEKFKKTGLRIVTFNYDRSLEYYLLNCITAAYGPDQVDLLRSIPIVHIYGQLGDLKEVPYDAWASAREPERLDLLERAAGKISIVHEQPEANVGFEQAQKLMEIADRICVLGFGFDMTNVRRLFPKSLLSSGRLRGTTYGLSEQMIPILNKHGFAGFYKDKSYDQRLNYWPSITIYEWLNNHLEGALDQLGKLCPHGPRPILPSTLLCPESCVLRPASTSRPPSRPQRPSAAPLWPDLRTSGGPRP